MSVTFHGKRWALHGEPGLFRKRDLRRIVQVSGGVLYKDLVRCSNDVDVIVFADDLQDTSDRGYFFRRTPKRMGESELAEALGMLATNQERLSLLRVALQRDVDGPSPNRERFLSALPIVEAWPRDEGFELGVTYMADLTHDWLPEDRPGTRRLFARASSGPAPLVGVIGSFDYDSSMFRPGGLPLAIRQAANLHTLTVRMNHHRDAFVGRTVRRFFRAVAASDLRVLRLQVPLSRDAADLIVDFHLPNLERLDYDPRLGQGNLTKLRARNPHLHLRRLATI